MKKEKKIEITQAKNVSTEEVRDILKNNMELIQSNISSIMASKNISQSELAKAIESEPGHINYILRKKNKGITIKMLGRIAKSLDVKTYELIK